MYYSMTTASIIAIRCDVMNCGDLAHACYAAVSQPKSVIEKPYNPCKPSYQTTGG